MLTLNSSVFWINGGTSRIELSPKQEYHFKIGISFLFSLIILLGWLVWFVSIQPVEIGRELIEAIGFSSKVIVIILKAIEWGLR